MFKLVVLAAVLAVVAAVPGGHTGVPISWGHGPIVAPQVISHAVPVLRAHVVHQPIAPVVHSPPVVTKTVLAGHGYAPVPVWGHH
ncbi:uncharacterized protein [Neodiprion pinetum]|uniref:Uncharacterized protein LOC107226301 n=1 Tax=Neodiprion lecontei TaxID=441921 RepID=A0A6J0C878_NEOLC|nr:uncharacterized protein LOC107226301 [Neodiprion lecontei]XP_046416482.1 uncharacterized protein LOC124177753 [Neodiprion fabricii]XP_046475915.1 uncharacterized protein LOC124215971 [Neodiprion pinetum]XP_046630462.1 uncharacterized protein LOC124310496 [Neodiprion virginianus]